MIDQIQIEVPSIPENIRVVESFIDNIKDKYHINDDIYGNIMIAVTEAVNNAIVHGNQSDSNKNVILSLFIDKSFVQFRIKDQGHGFDYNDLKDPTIAENLEKSSGRGIFLIKNLCDEVTFKEGGKIIELSFYMD